MALLGFLFLATGIPLGGWWTRAGASIMGPGTAAVLAGLVLVATTQFAETGTQEISRNPFVPDPASLEVGQQAYQQSCQTCHGAEGRGNGPAAAEMDPPPADLVVHVPLHPDLDLFRFIDDGISGTAMAPLGDTLTEEEIWHIINYVQTFEE